MISPKAQKILEDYFNLPFVGVSGVRCPYYNNARQKQRAQLRVLIGKGTPKEITEEAKIISIQYHAGIFDTAGHCCLHAKHNCGSESLAEDIRRFLIDHNLGIECSGFVTQILRAHFKEIKKIDITRHFFIISPRYFFRWLVAKIRPVENIGAKSYLNDSNTQPINYLEARSADVIVMLETGPNKKRNHILLITERSGNIIKYVHARQWVADGKYGHGVAKGEIKIINPTKGLLEQEWTESAKSHTDNETFLEAKNAAVLAVRRIRF